VCRAGIPVLVFDAVTGECRCELPLSDECEADGAAFSADGRFLAYAERAGDARHVRVCEIPTGTAQAVLQPDRRESLKGVSHLVPAYLLEWSPDGHTLATADRGGIVGEPSPGIELWDVAAGRRVRTLPGPDGGFCVATHFSPDGRFLAAAFQLQARAATADVWSLRSWNVGSGAEVLQVGGDWAGVQPGRPWVHTWTGQATPRAIRVFEFAGGEPSVVAALGPDDMPVRGNCAMEDQTFAIVTNVENPVVEWLASLGVPWPWDRLRHARIRFVDGPTGRVVGRLPSVPIQKIDYMAAWGWGSRSGQLFALDSADRLSVWDVPPPTPWARLLAPVAVITFLVAGLARWRVSRLRTAVAGSRAAGGAPSVTN
jgi:hypothetical protein